ncbi:DNA gyrase subunit A [Inquilinus limosus]|uniref:DNA gyrase subunit A n=1 Tax=Inquilinus limosus TaxID=171674 RepID=UPI00040519E1|nr:DNA gyrase subunit A [Inquilinus limosus]
MTERSPTPPHLDITPVTIEEEMRRSYLDYAMSVIVSRALPDVRDGLKPVHRRILFAMKEGGYDSTKPFKKSARVVGDVMGKYHPHGDTAIYDAMVRMAQDFSMRLPLIQGQGNFGSMDGDPPAAMRYTEARLAKAAEAMLDDIDKDTVEFQPNYDETQSEPTVLPSRFPNLLVNGAGGIAVGMATNIPPHNLGEVIDACLATIENPGITIEELNQIVPGPDFPTGALILGRSGIRSAVATGRGSVVMRARSNIEEIRKDREAIIFTEIPYQVNKSRLMERIAEVVNDKTVEGISELRDESDRDGVRIVVELKRDASADVVLNQLYRSTPLQTSFGVNMLALHGGRPELLNLKQIIDAFVAFREEVITRRTRYLLGRARERAHVLVGLATAVVNIDEVIELIRRAPDPQTAREELMARAWPAGEIAPLIRLVDEPGHPLGEDDTYRLSEAQARAILDLRLHRLTGLERDKIGDDLRAIVAEIQEYLAILSSREKLLEIMRGELAEMKEQFATPRKTEILDLEFEADIEDLIQREDMVVTVSNGGYIKRVPLSTYRAQRRGGKGRSGMATKEEDFVSDLFVANTHTPMLFFSSRGIVYKLKVYRLPIGTPQSRGKAMVNMLPLQQGETISTVMPLPEDESTWDQLYVMFATASGNVRRNSLADFTSINRNGKIAMKLDEGDSLIGVKVCSDDQDVLLATHTGMCIRFPVTDVRVFKGRDSTGVRGIRLADGDNVISISILHHLDASPDERANYLRMANAMRRAEGEETDGADQQPVEEHDLDPARFAELEAGEEFILTVSEEGFGKLSSAYGYRITGRGGKGIWTMAMGEKNSAVTACFPISPSQEIILVTDGGQLIRCPVSDVRIAARKTMGVRLFNVAEGERVVSVASVPEENGTNGEGDEAVEDGVEASGDAAGEQQDGAASGGDSA